MSSQGLIDFSLLGKQDSVPREFYWLRDDPKEEKDELMEPLVDLQGFFQGDEEATQRAAMLVRDACLRHGFFQVTNHGVDPDLVRAAHERMDWFFSQPLDKKLTVKKPGSLWGYSFAHAERFSSKLLWNENLSFEFCPDSSNPVVAHFFRSHQAIDMEAMGEIYQKYCQAMHDLSLAILELLAIGLGVERQYLREFFEDGCSIMRCNYYPPCPKPELVAGTGPHRDPTTITILHQNQVQGLEVFADNKWQTVKPRPDAFVVNIGDTFMALSNGNCKSCLHRAVVNKDKKRTSLAFFLCPEADKVIRPPQSVVRRDGTRMCPDFKWSQLLEFSKKHSRVNEETFQRFCDWLSSSEPLHGGIPSPN